MMRKPKRLWPVTRDNVTGAFVDLETGELYRNRVHIKRDKPKLGESCIGDTYTVAAVYDELTDQWVRCEVR